MSLFARLFGDRVELPPALENRINAWREIKPASEQVLLADATFVVVDVETSGLDPRRDRLLAIGACLLSEGRLWSGAGFERIIFQTETSSKDNILIHGIAPGEQSGGIPPEQALVEFFEFARKHVLVAYHAQFDRTVIDRATRAVLGTHLPYSWLDLADLAPALFPEARLPHGSLDDWLYRFGIHVVSRHRAMDDVLATGELMLILLNQAKKRGLETVGQLLAEAEAQQHSHI
ncbi:MAG: 3'-5' exonuclease [Acidiferrobacterales bacterium]|nr:3'-5' exonuclease [Acidiferrobacterales bacterium]